MGRDSRNHYRIRRCYLSEVLRLAPVFVLLVSSSLIDLYASSSTDARQVVDEFYRRYNVTDEVDLIFVLDRSGSVTRDGWISMINFVKNILDHFTIDRDYVRVSMVTFGSTATVEFTDLELGVATENVTKCTVYRRLYRMIDEMQLSGRTATSDGLKQAYNLLLNTRVTAKKAVLLLTESVSNIGDPPRRTSLEIQRLRWSQNWNASVLGPQVEIFSFGIASASPDEVQSVASELTSHFHYFPDFATFQQFSRSIREDNLEEKWVDAEMRNCGSTCRRNVANAKCMCSTRMGQFACACGPGHEMDDLSCRPCLKGYYKESYIPEPCRPCPPNTTTSKTGSTSTLNCHPFPG